MTDFSSICFVCGISIDKNSCKINQEVNLPVCESCKGTENEKKAVEDSIEGLAEGFVCGCI